MITSALILIPNDSRLKWKLLSCPHCFGCHFCSVGRSGDTSSNFISVTGLGRLACACYGCVYESILYGCWMEILVWLRVTIPSLHTAVGSALVPKSTLWSCTAKKTVCKSLLTNQLMHHIARKCLLDILAFVLYCAVQYIWLFCSSKKFFNGDKKRQQQWSWVRAFSVEKNALYQCKTFWLFDSSGILCSVF